MDGKELNCGNTNFLGEGGEGIVVKCKDKFNKQYAIKLADPTISLSGECQLFEELTNAKAINNTIFYEPIVFNTKFGRENIIKYFNSNVIGLTGENVRDINNHYMKEIQKDIDKAEEKGDQNAKEEAIRRQNSALQDVKDKINRAMTVEFTNPITGNRQTKCLAVLDFCDQGDLFEFIRNHPEYMKDIKLFRDMVYQIFSGLVYLYNKKICHWDIKPENILVKTNINSITGKIKTNKPYLFKIADYGTVLLDPVNTITKRLQKRRFQLMDRQTALNFMKDDFSAILNGTNIDINPDLEPINLFIDVISTTQTYETSQPRDISYEFQTTLTYTPSNPIELATFYRDIYAFVLSIFKLLNPESELFKTENGPIIDNDKIFKMSVLASRKKANNFIYQYCKEKPFSKKAKLLLDIARIVKDIEEKIETQSEYLYYIQKHNGIIYYQPQKFIINIPDNLLNELYSRINELFETHNNRTHSKTLKSQFIRSIKYRPGKITKKKTPKFTPKLLSGVKSSNNINTHNYKLPENFGEDLIENENYLVYFINSSTVDT
jgi:serine/threonine protein kinase